VLLGVAVGCGASATPPPAQADVERLGARYPDTTLAELERGRKLYLSRCTSCHAPVAPTSIPADQWPREVFEMSERAGLADEEPLVVKYLVAQSLRGRP
jgi:cytochrome c5